MNDRRRIAELDGLRALSFLCVFQHHIDGQQGWGWAIEVFFVLCSYLLVARLLEERERTGSIEVLRFYRRRVFRIWPAYYLTLALAAWFRGDRASILSMAFFVGNFAIAKAGTWPPLIYQLWSTCLEEQFYLVVPWLVRSRRQLRIGAWVVLVGSVLLRLGFLPGQSLWWYTVFHPEPFAVGILLATETKLPRLGVVQRWIVLAAGIGVMAYFAGSGRYVTPAMAVGSGLVVLSALSGKNEILAHPVLAWLGERSYGLYLFHAGALRLVVGGIPALVVTTALAALSYRYLEQPCIRYGRRTRSFAPEQALGVAS